MLSICGCAEETIHHILLYCTIVSALWEIIFNLVGVHWVFPKTMKEAITSWKGSFVGQKRKKAWRIVPLCIFWSVWKERNCIIFKDETLTVQRLKLNFVYNLWSWNRVYLGEEASSLIGFLEWLASN